MFNIFDNKKIKSLSLLVIILIAFFLRLYAAFSIPHNPDEIEKINFVKEISFAGEKINLPLGSKVTHNPLLLPYLMKISFSLFGENKIAARLPVVIFGTLTLLILYYLVKSCLDQKTAIVCLILLTFSQYHIGWTRIAEDEGLLLFFVVLILFLMQNGLHLRKRAFLIPIALMMGLGLLVKGTIFTLLPMIVFYLFFYPKNKNLFSAGDLLVFLLIIVIIVSPSIYWNIKNNYPDYHSYLKKTDFLSFSLVPTSLFLGEIIIFGMHGFNDSFIHRICSIEYPFLNWLMGLICVAGSIFFLREERNDFILLLLWIFYFNFIFFSFVRPKTGGGFYFHLDNFWWAAVSVIPGFILGSAMLVELSNRYKIIKFILPFILLYFIINSIIFINFPANCFIPRDNIKAKELFDTAGIYLKEGKKEKALKVYGYIKRHYPKHIDADINIKNDIFSK
nr:hypothetical protein [Nanoarchaeum sp.]